MTNTGKRRKTDEETTYWLSYSDMMAGLLLTFVLIIAFTMMHAKMQYDAKETELLGKDLIHPELAHISLLIALVSGIAAYLFWNNGLKHYNSAGA